MNTIALTALPGKQEVTITNIIDAPREEIFQTVTNPRLLPRWWGPSGSTTIVEKMDVRPGGEWRLINRDAGGTEYAFHGVYHDVVPNERLVYTFEYEGMPGHVTLETVTYADFECKTKVTDHIIFQSVEDRDGMLRAGMEEGLTETMGRFTELLDKTLALANIVN